VIAVDTNVLVYCHRAESPWHAAAAACVKGLAEGTASWAIPWPCVHEFLAKVTHPRIFSPPTDPRTALQFLAALAEAPRVSFLGEAPDHFARLERLVTRGQVTGARVHDARVAAICISHGVVELWTADRDFGRFPEVKTRNPLVGATQ
jgi:uncharacterized protein